MPVVRYRTRDLTALLPGTARSMRRLARLKGRSDDMLIIRGVNVFPSQIEALLAADERLAPHYLLELRRPARLDELVVVVELRPNVAGTLTSADIEDVEHDLERRIKAYIGVTGEVRVVAPATIERSQGKAKRVVDLRSRG